MQSNIGMPISTKGMNCDSTFWYFEAIYSPRNKIKMNFEIANTLNFYLNNESVAKRKRRNLRNYLQVH